MRCFRPIIAGCLVFLAAWLGAGWASADAPGSPSAPSELRIPPDLPRYNIDAQLDLAKKSVSAVERVTFTNRSEVPTSELVFHVYPRYHAKPGDLAVLSKTLEFLRLSPEEALDEKGQRMDVQSVTIGKNRAKFDFDPNDETILVVTLDEPVEPGKSVEAEIAFTLDLPEYWGRWGSHNGITYLVNWYPVLAHHDDKGWEHTPFIPWHQPWHQEAGHYLVRFDIPDGQTVASSGRIVDQEKTAEGRQSVTMVASPARDFAFVCSAKFQTLEQQVGHVKVRVHTFEVNRPNAEEILKYACEVIPLYEQWFGPYPDSEFEIAPSYFGWNGNECSGLVLIDDRVFRLPSVGLRYLDQLISHETCHQWWWNTIGTDGYAETFMDEGLVTAFTALRMDLKYGKNPRMIVWPRAMGWLPTIGREDLRLSGYYGWRAKGNGGAVIRDMKEMGNLNALFSLAYDRGGKVIEMMHNRLGPERFFAFFRTVYHKYAFQTLHYEDLKRELVAFDPDGKWDAFLDGWLIEHGETDWSIGNVRYDLPIAGEGGREVRIELLQKKGMAEPTVVLCKSAEGELRIPIWPERGSYEVPGAAVSHEPATDRWVILATMPGAPTQVEVDPEHALLDAVPDNNRWKREISWRLTPAMTPLDQSSQFQAYDRVSVVAGPFVDQYARGGFKVGVQRMNKWQFSFWAGTEPALREAIFGGQLTFFNMPRPSWSSGLFYEEGLYNFYNDQRHSGGRAFVRYRMLESSSFIVDDQGFIEAYFGTGNEFWAGDTGRPVNGWLDAVGLRYRLSTLFPYWDPVKGRLLEFTGEYGDKAFGSAYNYSRFTAEYGFVRPIPEGWGRLSKSRIAYRAYGGFSYPDNLNLFRLGGGTRLRALDLAQFQGSSVWLSTLEWRFPLWANIDEDFADHVVGFRNLIGTVFYDVGQSYLRGHFSDVVHGIGVGFRVDTALFAFLERASMRVDLAQPVGIGTKLGPVLWFGLNQVF
jgi:Peptidase family M1 domain